MDAAARRSEWQKLTYPSVYPKHDGYLPSADAAPAAHCATCSHYAEWHSCEAGDRARPAKAADDACELYAEAPVVPDGDEGHSQRRRKDTMNGRGAGAYGHPGADPHEYEATRPLDGNSGTACECRYCGYGPGAHSLAERTALVSHPGHQS